MDKTKLCKIENGDQEPRAIELERIASELQLSMPEFYGAVTSESAAS